MKKETGSSEGFNCIFTASFILTDGQVVGSSLVKFLIWEKHRFRFFHEICYIPVEDIFDLLNEKGINVNLQKNRNKTYF